MEGIRVVEVASWTFVPAAGAVLAEWGADVLKIEHPESGDPQRGLISSGMIPGGAGGVNYMMEQPNHGKRSVAINLGHPDGRAVLYKLCETADVFVTNWLPGARQRQQIDVDDIRAVNPSIIYVRGHGQGTRGPDADKGGRRHQSLRADASAGVRRPSRWPDHRRCDRGGVAAQGTHRRGQHRRRVAARLRYVVHGGKHRVVEAV
jgi:crotonobetainyl-CoA:carnitine CoA-transferase CaiB-like acyl-CoA transferase